MPVDNYVLWICGEKFFRSRAAQLMPVTYVYLDFIHWYDQLLRKTGITGRIGVAEYCLHRRDHAKLVENFAPADITGVENEIYIREGIVNRRAQKAVGIRNQTNNSPGAWHFYIT